MAKLDSGKGKVKTLQLSGHHLECFGGNLEFGQMFLMIASCLLACLLAGQSTVILLAKSIDFPSLTILFWLVSIPLIVSVLLCL